MRITSRTAVLALFGDPVGHSLSPVMHNGWIGDHGLDAVYVALRIATAQAPNTFVSLRNAGFRGANVTVPHKQSACLAVDSLDPTASALKAVNVLRWEDDGAISGFNTDAPGLVSALDESHAGWRSTTGAAVVLGAGGAARAAVWGLAQAGVKRVLVVNRTLARAEETAALTPRAHAFAWDQLGDLFASADLIVNTTTLGMAGSPPMEWPIERTPDHCIVMDSVYAPLETELLRAARARGLTTVDGLGMLIHQGALAFDIWFGVTPDVLLARVRLMQAISDREKLLAPEG
ncbi:MAG: shikimate dehydrogenase [Hyphomonadaceae bacterium]